jgi:hypothetical protein
LEKKKADI